MKTKQKKSLKKLPMTGLDYGLLLLFFIIFFFDKLYLNKLHAKRTPYELLFQITLYPQITDLQNRFLLLDYGFDMVWLWWFTSPKSQILKIIFCFWVVGLIWSDYGGLLVAVVVGGGGGGATAC